MYFQQFIKCGRTEGLQFFLFILILKNKFSVVKTTDISRQKRTLHSYIATASAFSVYLSWSMP